LDMVVKNLEDLEEEEDLIREKEGEHIRNN
jgi:hypothetical protein